MFQSTLPTKGQTLLLPVLCSLKNHLCYAVSNQAKHREHIYFALSMAISVSSKVCRSILSFLLYNHLMPLYWHYIFLNFPQNAFSNRFGFILNTHWIKTSRLNLEKKLFLRRRKKTFHKQMSNVALLYKCFLYEYFPGRMLTKMLFYSWILSLFMFWCFWLNWKGNLNGHLMIAISLVFFCNYCVLWILDFGYMVTKYPSISKKHRFDTIFFIF